MDTQTANNLSIALWLFPKGLNLHNIHSSDEEFLSELSSCKYDEYSYTRRCAKYALGSLFQTNPLNIPLDSRPGRKPTLRDGWGYLSLSHCEDAIVVGWSSYAIGVDIERKDRKFLYKKICKRFFTQAENIQFDNTETRKQREFVLKTWIMKEAAFKCQENPSMGDFFNWEKDNDLDICSNQRASKSQSFFLINYQYWSVGIASSFLKWNQKPIICICEKLT